MRHIRSHAFADPWLEASYAQHYAHASALWRFWWALLISSLHLVAAAISALRRDEPWMQPPLIMGLYYVAAMGAALTEDCRPVMGGPRGGAEPRPWRPRMHELLCLINPAFFVVHYNTVGRRGRVPPWVCCVASAASVLDLRPPALFLFLHLIA